MVADKHCGRDVGQQEQRKWRDTNSDRGVIVRGRRGGEGVGEIKSSLSGEL